MSGPVEFEDYVRARWVPLVRLATLLTGDVHTAQDLVQEALIRTAGHWGSIDPGAIDAYVRRVLYTRNIDAWRWRRRQPDPVAVEGDGAGTGRQGALREHREAWDADSRIVLQAALRTLTHRQRAVLVLRFYEDRTEVETAAILGCSVNTVKSQVRHALERLRVLNPGLVEAFGRSEVGHG